MAELINTDFGVVARVKNSKGALKHRKIVPITDEAELAAYKGRYPVKFIPLTEAEDNWLKDNYTSLAGAIKEGAIESAYKHAASAAEFANQAMKGGYRELETRERAKNRALNSPYRRTSPSERQETAVEIAIRDNPWKDKDDPALIEARNRWTEQAENRDANQGYYGHEIVGGLSEGLTSPTTFIPGVAAGRGVGALGKAAVAGGALNVADEALRVYGDDTLTNSEKAARLGLAGAFGAAGGALINAATQGARKGVDAFKKWRSAKNPTDAQALDVSSNINRNFDDLINGELSESSEVIPAYELPESKITRKAREAAEDFSETAGDTFGPVPMGSGRFPMLERKVKNTKTKVPREIVRNEEKIKDIISRSLIRHENKPLLKRTADADSNRRLQSEQIAKSVSEHRKELISDLRNAAAYPEEIKRIVSEFDRINAPADKPVLTITGKEFGNYKDIKDLRNRATQYYKDNLSGKKVETEVGEIFFPISGFKKPINSSEIGKLLLFRHLPNILRSGKLVGIEPDRAGRQNVKEWLIFETPLNINGKDEIARVNVRRDNNGRLYYDHVIKKEFSGKTPIQLQRPAGPENSLNKSAPYVAEEASEITVPRIPEEVNGKERGSVKSFEEAEREFNNLKALTADDKKYWDRIKELDKNWESFIKSDAYFDMSKAEKELSKAQYNSVRDNILEERNKYYREIDRNRASAALDLADSVPVGELSEDFLKSFDPKNLKTLSPAQTRAYLNKYHNYSILDVINKLRQSGYIKEIRGKDGVRYRLSPKRPAETKADLPITKKEADEYAAKTYFGDIAKDVANILYDGLKRGYIKLTGSGFHTSEEEADMIKFVLPSVGGNRSEAQKLVDRYYADREKIKNFFNAYNKSSDGHAALMAHDNAFRHRISEFKRSIEAESAGSARPVLPDDELLKKAVKGKLTKEDAARLLSEYYSDRDKLVGYMKSYGASKIDIERAENRLRFEFEKSVLSTDGEYSGSDYQKFLRNKINPVLSYEWRNKELENFLRETPERGHKYKIDFSKVIAANKEKYMNSGFFYNPISNELEFLIEPGAGVEAALREAGFNFAGSGKWIHGKRKKDYTAAINSLDNIAELMNESKRIHAEVNEALEALESGSSNSSNKGGLGFQKYLADTTKQNLSRGIVGGIAGVGKEGYDSYSEDREFSFSEAGKNALVGFGAAGPGLGFTIKSVGKNSKRPTTVDSSAEKISGSLFGKVRRVVDRIGETDTANYWINTKFNKRTDYLNFREDFMRGIREAHSKLEIVYKALNELTLYQRTELHKYLVGEGETAPKAIKELGDKFRREINRLGSRAVNLGILSRDTFDEWKNIYLHRSYQDTLFGNLSKLGRSKSIHPIYKRGKEWTGNKDELQRYMEAGMIGDHISAGKIVYKKNSNGSYTFRRDWTPEERANMGEITDGAFTVTETLARLNDMIYAGEFLRNVAIGTNTAVKEEIHGYKRLNGQKWGALKDLYVPKDVYDDLNNTYNNLFGHQNDWLKLWNKYISSLKSSWTVLNPIAHFNNFISNVAFMSTSGMPVTKAFTGAMRSWGILKEADKLKSIKARQIAGTATNADAEEYARLISNDDVKMFFEAEANGVFGRGRLQEMLYNHGVADVVSNNPLKRGYDKVDNMLQKAYEAEDNAGRLAFYSYLRKDLGLSTEEAVKGVREIIPDYTRPISSGANMLRNTGVMPFVSWTYNTLPMIIKQTYGVLANPLGKSKYGSGSFGLGKYQAYNSLKAVFGVLLLNQIISGVTGAPSMLNGEQPRNWQGRRFTWGYDGDVYGLKIDRWLPHSDFLPLNVGSWGYNQLTGGIPQKAITALAGVDAYHGTPITRREGLEKIYDYGKYAGNNFIPIPEYLRRAGGMIESAIADEDKRRRSNFYNPRGALSSLAGLAGLNVSSYNRDAYLKEEENKKLKSEKKEKKNKRKELIDERKKRREKLYPNRRKRD